MTLYSLVITTTDSRDNAKKIASNALNAKLVACVQYNKIESIFSFESKIREAQEYKILMKIRAQNYKNLEKLILKYHTYKVPEIISINIDKIYGEYANWIHEVCI